MAKRWWSAVALIAGVALSIGDAHPIGLDRRPIGSRERQTRSAEEAPPDYSKVFDLTVLHRVDIEVRQQHIDTLNSDTAKPVPCVFTYDAVTLPRTGIRKKGGIGSVRDLFDKTGFSVDFDEFEHSGRLGGLKKITLNNAVQDPSFLSEHLGYEIYRRAGLPAPLTAHALVVFNGQPFGLYVVKESVDEQFLARNFGVQNDSGSLYEGAYFVDFTPDVNVKGLELKGEVKDERSRQDLQVLAELVQGTPAAEWAATVGAKLDLESFITGFAIDAIVDHWDGYAFQPNNYYIYHNPASAKFVFIPHGMDQLFQNDSDFYRSPAGALAMKVRETMDQTYRDKVRQILDKWDMGALFERMDQVSRTVHSFNPLDERTKNDYDRFDSGLQRMKDAVARRKPR